MQLKYIHPFGLHNLLYQIRKIHPYVSYVFEKIANLIIENHGIYNKVFSSHQRRSVFIHQVSEKYTLRKYGIFFPISNKV